jgi:type IV secretory pathway TrbF-like protein
MSAKGVPENPYLAARQEWNERYGSYVNAARAWRIVGVLGLAMAVISFTYTLYLSTQVKLVPYIVEVDKIEYADPRVVRAALGNFVTSFRSITPDAVVQKQYIDRTYALLRTSDPSTQKINAWFRSNPPFEKARTATLAIEVNNIVALSNRTYQIDWTEYERDRKGRETATRRFRGIATVALTAPQDEATIRLAVVVLGDGAHPQGLTSNEVKGTEISTKWRGSAGLVTTGPDGKVIFLFGQTQPSVVCSPLQVCDIELQAGEVVRDVLVGDTVRWKVEPATSGAAGSQSVHLVVKPSEPGLVTSMVVTTSPVHGTRWIFLPAGRVIEDCRH